MAALYADVGSRVRDRTARDAALSSEIARKASTEIFYLITSLPPETASPQRLLRLARDHWGIENRLHYVRDVAFAEDRCRVRAGARPLASLRNLAITLIRRAGLSIEPARTSARIAPTPSPSYRPRSLNDPGKKAVRH